MDEKKKVGLWKQENMTSCGVNNRGELRETVQWMYIKICYMAGENLGSYRSRETN